MNSITSEFNTALVELLTTDDQVTASDLGRAATFVQRENMPLETALLKLGLVEEEQLLSLVAGLLDLPYYERLKDSDIDLDTLALLSPEYCAGQSVVPIRDEDGALRIVCNRPNDTKLTQELSFYLDTPVQLGLGAGHLIRSLNKSVRTPDEGEEDAHPNEPNLTEADGPVIRFVHDTLQDAITLGASDVHFESQENGLRIRNRVEGILQPCHVDRSLGVDPILARVKVLANMNVSERRLPQDGRMSLTIAGRRVDFRVSSIPTSFGESLVCRVLDPKALRLGWDRLGFSERQTADIKELIEQPSGLFLVTGPTGSGKTTTLYTALSHLNTDQHKILTVEDPVEYNLAGVEQVQVHEEVGMTFAKALRSLLRQDPNVIMVGEIRDSETAEIACRAALVGRMVLSTLHTNSPQEAVTRLLDLGVPEYVVQSVLRGTLGQTLEVSSNGPRTLNAELVTYKNSIVAGTEL